MAEMKMIRPSLTKGLVRIMKMRETQYKSSYLIIL